MSASAELQISSGSGPFVGFANMLDKEFGTWWRTRRALLHLGLWLFVINGLLTIIGFDEQGGSPAETLDAFLEIFFLAGGLFTTIGIVLSTQSSLVSERQMGTAEWVLSKPVTRESFLLAKIAIDGASFLWLAVVVPSTLLLYQTLYFSYLLPEGGPFLLGLALHVQHLVFYLTLTLALGAFLNSRGAVAGAAIGFLFFGAIVPNFFPSTRFLSPWGHLELASLVGTGGSLPPGAWQPITLTGLYIVLLMLMAIWRFRREEF